MSSQNEWPRVCIKDVCESIIDCVNKTAPVVDSQTPYKMIRTTNVKNGWIDVSEVKYVEEGVFKKWTRRGAPRVGDVILTREAPLGEVGLLRSNDTVFLGQRLVQYRADADKLDNRFLLYSFQADDLQAQIKSFGSGATVEHMRVPDAEQLTLAMPPLPTQHKIAAILSAYDDLIENNTRRISILEEMARALYREWFVHFRFPGHAEVPMVESALGPVPEGWMVQPLTAAVMVDPATKVPKGGDKPFVPMGSLSNTSMIIRDVGSRTGNSGSKFRNGDTLFARITPCIENGKTGFVQFLPTANAVAFGSTEFIVLRSRTLRPEYVYLLARSAELRDMAIKSMSGATSRQRVQSAVFSSFLFAHPDANVLDRFQALAGSIFQQVHTLAVKNDNLRRTRDLLLPKLISGELDVEELDIATVEADV